MHQLALKTVNGARSAYVCFLFQRSFFHSYSDRRAGARDGGDEVDEAEDETLKCKITIKVRAALTCTARKHRGEWAC